MHLFWTESRSFQTCLMIDVTESMYLIRATFARYVLGFLVLANFMIKFYRNHCTIFNCIPLVCLRLRIVHCAILQFSVKWSWGPVKRKWQVGQKLSPFIQTTFGGAILLRKASIWAFTKAFVVNASRLKPYS